MVSESRENIQKTGTFTNRRREIYIGEEKIFQNCNLADICPTKNIFNLECAGTDPLSTAFD
jgi:hypothetical protein